MDEIQKFDGHVGSETQVAAAVEREKGAIERPKPKACAPSSRSLTFDHGVIPVAERGTATSATKPTNGAPSRENSNGQGIRETQNSSAVGSEAGAIAPPKPTSVTPPPRTHSKTGRQAETETQIRRATGGQDGLTRTETQTAGAILPSLPAQPDAEGAMTTPKPTGRAPPRRKKSDAPLSELAGHRGPETRSACASKARRARHRSVETQMVAVGAAPLSEISGHVGHETHQRIAGDSGVGHVTSETHSTSADPAIITEIREQWRRHQAWHRAEKSLTLQAKALCRRLATDGDKAEADLIYRAALGMKDATHPLADVALAAMFPITQARDSIKGHRKPVEDVLEKAAKNLPAGAVAYVKETWGASLLALAKVVGEAGDIGAFPYTNPGKLWKRFGLAPRDGKAMATWRSKGGLTGADWEQAGYSPARRSVMWNVGSGLIGGMGKGQRPEVGADLDQYEDWSPFERMFVERLRHEAARDPEMRRPDTKEGKESFSRHAAARAKRYVEKRFLRDLWVAWRHSA